MCTKVVFAIQNQWYLCF